MEIISRTEAITRGLRKYFTGDPCRNGHLAQRYTQSSTCEDCLKATKGTIIDGAERIKLLQDKLTLERDKFEFRRQIHKERGTAADHREIIGRMIKTKIRARAADMDFIYDAALAFANLRSKLINRRDVVLAYAPKNSMWGLRCFPADLDAIQEFSNSIWQERGGDLPQGEGTSVTANQRGALDIAEARRRALESAEREAAALEEPPAWKP
jgi:hypothetical protein